MENGMQITVGSTRIHKLNAVREACRQLGLEVSVTGIKAPSGQNEQPVGLNETFRGALTRAGFAKTHDRKSIAIGIETGIFRSGDDSPVTLDISVIVILTPDGRRIVTTGTGIEFPEKYVRLAEDRGFETTTVGSMITKELGGETGDPYPSLTHGRITRSDTLVNGLIIALKQL